MEQKLEQSALITDHGDEGPFSWPPAIWIGVMLCLLGTLTFWYFHGSSDEEHYRNVARGQIWTTYSVGNPHTYVLANVRQSVQDKDTICGRVNYEKTNNGGWSGFTDFYVQKGVFYIVPSGGRYEKQFAFLCLTPGKSQVDQPESVPTSNGMAGQESIPLALPRR